MSTKPTMAIDSHTNRCRSSELVLSPESRCGFSSAHAPVDVTRHVLVPIDDSTASRRAFEYALAEFPDAKITALHLFDATHPAIYADSTGGSVDRVEAFEIRNREQGASLLGEATQLAAERDREVETALHPGTVPDGIVKHVTDADVDHLIVGTDGRTNDDSLLGTSVAARVAARVPAPVTVVGDERQA